MPACNHVMLMMKGVNFVDVAGAEMLMQEARRRKALGGGLYLYGANPAVLEVLAKTGYFRDAGKGGLFDSKSVALKTLVPRLDDAICKNCTARIFNGCQFKAGSQTSAATVAAPSRLTMAACHSCGSASAP